MTIKTFWTILIKILGIWLVLDSISVLLEFVPTLLSAFEDQEMELFLVNVLSLLFTIGIYFFILRLFVFKTAWLIEKLELEKGFEEEKLVFDLPRTTILTIAVIVIGGLMFVSTLPQLCNQVFISFRNQSRNVEDPESGWIVFYLVKILIAYVFMTHSHRVVQFVNKTNKQEKDPAD